MSLILSSFIDRTDFKRTIAHPKELRMPAEQKDISIKQVEAKSQQNGVINNKILGKSLETTFEFLHIHLNSAMSVIAIVILVVGLCCLWRFMKMKNLRKIAKFICLRKCRVTEEMLEEEEKTPKPRQNQGAYFELLDINALVSLANKATVENAYLRTQQNRASVEETDLAAC